MKFLQHFIKLFPRLGSGNGSTSLFLVTFALILLAQNVGTTTEDTPTSPFPSSTVESVSEVSNSSSTTSTLEASENSNISDLSTSPFPETTPESEEERQRQKYVGTREDIILEHTDFVTLRLRHLLNQTSSNITELRILQQVEFLKSPNYQDDWNYAAQLYNESKKALIVKTFGKSPTILGAPPEYHIALIAYTGSFYYEFNSKTRELCSGFDIDNYEYKSFFKLLELAIDILGPEISHFSYRTNNGSTSYEEKVLYRGVNKIFALKIGQRLAFQHFISTSRNPNVATGFSWGNDTTVFEIHAGSGQPLGHGVYLGIHSMFSSEEEVLLSPLQVFEVESIDKERESGMMHVSLKTSSLAVNLPPIPQEECQLNLKSMEGIRNYVSRLKLAVAVMGAVLVTLLLSGGTLSLYMILTRRKFCYKTRTVSELALT